MVSKLNSVKTDLERWSKQIFKRAYYIIKKLRNILEKLHNYPAIEENMEKRLNLKKEVRDLWKQEETYWGTRAKINWLKWGGGG